MTDIVCCLFIGIIFVRLSWGKVVEYLILKKNGIKKRLSTKGKRKIAFDCPDKNTEG